MEGAFMGSQAPYGYKKSPTDKHKLIIDDEEAKIVRRVFLMFLAGDSARLIAEKLNGDKIDCAFLLNQAMRCLF